MYLPLAWPPRELSIISSLSPPRQPPLAHHHSLPTNFDSSTYSDSPPLPPSPPMLHQPLLPPLLSSHSSAPSFFLHHQISILPLSLHLSTLPTDQFCCCTRHPPSTRTHILHPHHHPTSSQLNRHQHPGDTTHHPRPVSTPSHPSGCWACRR